MNLNNKLVLFIVFILTSTDLLLGQTPIDISYETINYTRSLSPKIVAEGSPYIDESFQPVKVNDKDVIYSGRFNAYNGDMELILSDKGDPIALDSRFDFVVTFVNDKKTYQTYSFEDGDKNKVHGFLVNVFSTEHYSLLVREHIEFKEKVKAESSYDQEKPAKFVRSNDVYYLKLKDGSVVVVPRKSKDLAEFFPELEDKLEDYIKAEKIKSNREEDLIQFIKHLETL